MTLKEIYTQEGIQRGGRNVRKEVALKMLAKGFPYDLIKEMTGFDKQVLEKLAETNSL